MNGRGVPIGVGDDPWAVFGRKVPDACTLLILYLE